MKDVEKIFAVKTSEILRKFCDRRLNFYGVDDYDMIIKICEKEKNFVIKIKLTRTVSDREVWSR